MSKEIDDWAKLENRAEPPLPSDCDTLPEQESALTETVHDLIRALSAQDIEEMLALFGMHDGAPPKEARDLAALACRLWRDRAGDVIRVRRDQDRRRPRAWVRVFDHSGALLSIPVTLKRSEWGWQIAEVELRAQQFQTPPIPRTAPVTMDFLIEQLT